MSPAATKTPTGTDDTAMRRLRRCAWTGVAGLVAALPLVYSLTSQGGLDGYAAVAVLGWLVVAALTALCFRMANALRDGKRGPVTPLLLLALVALLVPGLPILSLAPWALFIGGARFFLDADPRELLFFGWGLFGVAFLVVIVTILLTLRRLRRRDREN